MTDLPAERSGLRARGEEALGELAQALLDNPLFNEAVARALGAGERAVQAQRAALGAVGVAQDTDLERLEQRLRSLSNRMEDVEDLLDRIAADLSALRSEVASAGRAASDREGAVNPGIPDADEEE